MFIERMKESFKKEEPIFTQEILSLFKEYTRTYVFRLISKAEAKGEIVSFDSGIYYLPDHSSAFSSCISFNDIISKKYINYNNNYYGVYSGLSVLNKFSVSTQVPHVIEIVTNNESSRKRKVNIAGRTVILRKSRCTINEFNVHAYQILELLTNMVAEEDFSKFVINDIKEYISHYNIKLDVLLNLLQYFPKRTTNNLLRLGINNVFTQ